MFLNMSLPPLNGAAIMNTKNKYNNVNNLPAAGYRVPTSF